ncbi:MAG: class I SAM-dependent methyltransferase [Anaerolineae bacterium]|jgi:SAM-dependent methyltransferase
MTKEQQPVQPIQIEEDDHWWFAGRTWSLLHTIDRLVAPDGSHRVLDVGCGAGNMFHHLARYGPVLGVDNNPRPLAVARERGYDVREGLAEDLPLDDEAFDLVALLDTVEHCEDEMAVLRECYRVCAPGGHLVVTVPAFMQLWSHNDVLNAHQRRYSAPELKEKLNRVGFRIRRMSYNNFFLFPLAAGLILLRKNAEQEPELASPHFDDESYQVEMEPAPPLLNTLLKAVTWTESQVLRWLNLPVGTSIICIAQKPPA